MLKSGEEAEIEQRYFEEFFEEVFTELDSKYGRIEEMNICDNIGISLRNFLKIIFLF